MGEENVSWGRKKEQRAMAIMRKTTMEMRRRGFGDGKAGSSGR